MIESPTGHTNGPSRRAIASSAWALPVVAVAVSAPLAAASEPTKEKAKLSFDYLNGYGTSYVNGHPTAVESGLQVQNVYFAQWPAVSESPVSIAVTVSYPDAVVSGGPLILTQGAPAWSATSASHVGSSWVYTLTYIGTVSPGSSTSNVVFHVPLLPGASGPVSIAAIASAVNATPATASATTYV